MKASWKLALSACWCASAVGLAIAPACAAEPSGTSGDATPNNTTAPPCGKLSGPGGPDAHFVLRDGEAVDFSSGGQTAHGKLLLFHDGALYRAYWRPTGQPAGSPPASAEKYALANAAPNGVRLISTPPQGTPANDGKPGIDTPPLNVFSCPKL
ncbi:hypothetical protein [Paraburkholderia sp.]|uniref:hypothetical protein n=1 Tax=Paraburkholderia sp. TaxID=1926495 RepID=UPI00286F87DC|nr:hypothetical protein [Paraburkholderia sp.]